MKLNIGNTLSFIIIYFFSALITFSRDQSDKELKNSVFVDDHGVMRWIKDNSEVALFGVNYTVPFAHAYRAHQYLGIPHEKAIEQDIYHMCRLGMDAFRVHVWDCEISDTIGNLLKNEHLRLLDYQLKLMKERGIKILITPIAYWGNGYPEPSEKTPGFSTKYGKEDCLTNPDAIMAQENYLKQFVSHINQYTGIAYKDDPDIIAFEVCNEPHHGGSKEEVKTFINKMVASIKNTGCEKPVFYNTSHSIGLAEAYYNAEIDGGTFQWYPTNLVHGFELQGNFLPNVSTYNIPFSNLENYKKAASIVYEFDAADIGRSYIYPYMAKSFREAGMQFIAHFSYDPLYMAYSNTEYTTHYMNLAYAPQKALSLMIAGEVTRNIPLFKKYGGYPTDSVFDVFRVSYRNDLAEMVSPEKFIYTNNTSSMPPELDKLKQIAGYGNSVIVKYDGTGAYFLDKLEDGIWRLEVMPDAQWVRDPFEKASLKKEVAVILWNNRNLTIHLPDLGNDFQIVGLNKGNSIKTSAVDKSLSIAPGTYLVIKKGKVNKYKPDDKNGFLTLDEFVAPAATCKKTYFLHQPVYEIAEGKNHTVEVKVISEKKPDSLILFLSGRRWRPEKFYMKPVSAFTYKVDIPGESIKEGILKYNISLFQDNENLTYPDEIRSIPSDWDYYGQNQYTVRVVKDSAALCLFDPDIDADKVYGNTRFRLIPSELPGENALSIIANQFDDEFPEHAVRFYFRDKIKGRTDNINLFNKIEITGYSQTEKNRSVQVALVMNDGAAYAGYADFKSYISKIELSLREFKKVALINLPNSYPVFINRYFEGCENCEFDINKVESIQFSIGPGLSEAELKEEHKIAVGKVIIK